MRKLFILFVMTALAVVLSAGSYPIKPGEKVMFFGDSITHDGRYQAFLQLILNSRGISGAEVMNAGISGQTAGGGLRRIQYDVIDRKPDRVFLLFGMNDIGRGVIYRVDSPENLKKRERGVKAFTVNQKKIIDILKAAGITPVLMTPTAYDQYQKDGKSDRCNEPGLSDIAAIIRKTAKEENLDFIELHSFMTEALKKHPELRLCGKDLVHPVGIGHLMMAALIAEQTGLTGPVAEVAISASGKVQSRFAKISALQSTPEEITFRYAPERLAVNIPAALADTEKVYSFSEKFNREILKVTGVAEGKYNVSADGKLLGSFSAAELAGGIDLATLATPNFKRAEKAMKTAMQIYYSTSTLRTLVQCRCLVFNTRFLPGTPDPGNYDAIVEALLKWRDNYGEKWPYRRYYTSQINNYKKNAPRENELKEQRKKILKQLEQETHPVSYTISIKKVK